MSSAQECATILVSKGKVVEKLKQIEEKKTTLANGQKYLIDMSLEVIRLQAEVESLKVVDEALSTSLQADLDSIKVHPIVKEASFENESIVMKTGWFKAFTQGGEAVPIPPMKIELNLLTAGVKGFNVADANGVRGCWTEHDPHPHVAGNTGSPCLGDATCAITEYITTQEYYAAMLMVLEFMQNVNEEDSAGAKYSNWIEKHGEKLEEL